MSRGACCPTVPRLNSERINMGRTVTELVKTTYIIRSCGECGITYGVPKWFDDECHEQGANKIWCCPNGHKRVYRKSATQKLFQDLQRERAGHDQTKASRDRWRKKEERTGRRLSATRGIVTRIKNRISNGVCPCCNRSFKNLKRHMGSQHPDYKHQPEQ